MKRTVSTLERKAALNLGVREGAKLRASTGGLVRARRRRAHASVHGCARARAWARARTCAFACTCV
eukprot:4849665-Pleurochrysis_carterae.AAC.2